MGILDFFRQLCCTKEAGAQHDEEIALPPRPYHCPRTAAKPMSEKEKKAEEEFAWRLYEYSGRIHYNPRDEEGTISRLYGTYFKRRSAGSRGRAGGNWWAECAVDLDARYRLRYE